MGLWECSSIKLKYVHIKTGQRKIGAYICLKYSLNMRFVAVRRAYSGCGFARVVQAGYSVFKCKKNFFGRHAGGIIFLLYARDGPRGALLNCY